MEAVVGGNPVLGTWKLKSYVVTAGTGEKSTPYGEHPMGYLSYSADGRMQAIGTSSRRIVPLSSTPTDQERVTLHETMFAYAGTYSLEAGKSPTTSIFPGTRFGMVPIKFDFMR